VVVDGRLRSFLDVSQADGVIDMAMGQKDRLERKSFVLYGPLNSVNLVSGVDHNRPFGRLRPDNITVFAKRARFKPDHPVLRFLFYHAR